MGFHKEWFSLISRWLAYFVLGFLAFKSNLEGVCSYCQQGVLKLGSWSAIFGFLWLSSIECMSFKFIFVIQKAHLRCANNRVKLWIPWLTRKLPAGIVPPPPIYEAKWSWGFFFFNFLFNLFDAPSLGGIENCIQLDLPVSSGAFLPG